MTFFHVRFFWDVLVTLVVITDPAGLVPIFLGLTGAHGPREQRRLAWQATVVALGVIVTFALFGQSILSYLGVQLPAMQAAGGLLLLLVALQLLTGTDKEVSEAQRIKTNVAFVPLGTPLLAGPGAIVATMLFVRRINGWADILAFSTAIVVVSALLWLAMRFSALALRLLRPSGVELATRISGLLLSAIAVQLVAGAVRTFVQQG